MQAVAAPVAIQRALPPEEAARADFYALLSRLLQAGADGALLRSLAGADPLPAGANAELARAWSDLVKASSAMDADAAADEHQTLFAGVGKSEVSVFSGYYTGAPAAEHPRVRIQGDLAALGLARRERVNEPEDHFAGLFDTMRILIAGGAGRAPSTVGEQRKFFQAHVKPGVFKFFDALARAKNANYYRKVAALGAAFLALESESFLLD